MTNKPIHKLGLPYMGSKRKLAKPIIDYILKHNLNTKYFYDVFGGGGAMSLEAIQRPKIKEVFYNDFNTGITELLKKLAKDGVVGEMYKWIDRDTFKKHKDDDTWYGGYLATVWSFGNNKDKGYLYGADIEEDKKLLHKIIVFSCQDSLNILNNKYNIGINLNNGIFKEDVIQRRLRIVSEIKSFICSDNSNPLVQHLIMIESLTRLQNLQNLQNLQISNLSYEKVNITTDPKETIIFLDPPYIDTAKYTKGICHKELYDWIEQLTDKGYKVYLTSYESPLICVKEFKHRSTLSATANNEVTEKLFSNFKDVIEPEKVMTQGSLF